MPETPSQMPEGQETQKKVDMLFNKIMSNGVDHFRTKLFEPLPPGHLDPKDDYAREKNQYNRKQVDIVTDSTAKIITLTGGNDVPNTGSFNATTVIKREDDWSYSIKIGDWEFTPASEQEAMFMLRQIEKRSDDTQFDATTEAEKMGVKNQELRRNMELSEKSQENPEAELEAGLKSFV